MAAPRLTPAEQAARRAWFAMCGAMAGCIPGALLLQLIPAGAVADAAYFAAVAACSAIAYRASR